MVDENSIANETFVQVVSVFESAWAWCVKNDSRFSNEAIHDIVGRMINAHEREVYKMPENNHNAPITTDLRKTLARIDAYNSTNVSELVEDNLNAIDSVHENLEIEYSELAEQTDMCRHHRPDTWERIIEDARTCTGSSGSYTAVPSMRWTNEMDVLIARCKALAGN